MKMNPLTPEEIKAASEAFFEAYNIVDTRMPKAAAWKTRSSAWRKSRRLKVSTLRKEKEKEERDAKFGFNKTEFLE